MDTQTTTTCSFTIREFEQVKEKVLNWTKQFNTFCFLDNHHYESDLHSVECILAAGVKRELKAHSGNAFYQLENFISEKNSWLFGHLGYDLKNEIEKLSSSNPDHLAFPELYFFEPEVLIRLEHNQLHIEAVNPQKVYKEILATEIGVETRPVLLSSDILQRMTRMEYLEILERLKQHIMRGDCYEINFCQEFYAEQAFIDPIDVYNRLSDVSPNPFSALYRVRDQWLICASPERFLKKTEQRIISQPMKGTARRNESKDEVAIEALYHSEKDRSENVMVVDLVRNDLSRICEDGTVKVDELYGIYSFPQVHQMVSTVSGILKDNISFSRIIKACFPMGSMTGAPKKKVMELIEKYEKTKRGIFSGAVGYINPEGDFDFNVVIRSIMYNAASRYLSFQAGSGVTYYSDPVKEWEECLLKAAAIKQVLTTGQKK